MSTKTNIIIGITSLILAAAGLIYKISKDQQPTIFNDKDRFYCTLRSDPFAAEMSGR